MKKQIRVTRVYDWLEQSKARINILRGGTGSSKSYSLSQFFIINKLCEQDNKTVVIARKTLPALKKTAYKETMDIIKSLGIPHSLNKSDMELRIKNNVCYFMSVDDPDKIASLQTDDVWLEEAVDFKFEDFHQFNMRMNGQMYLSFNPVSALHWIKKTIIDSGNYDVGESVSTHRDNPFLPIARRREIENLINIDQNYYKVYDQGEWGVLEDIIYSNWSVLEIPEKIDDISYGADWGFNNPASLVRVIWSDKKVIWQEKIYEAGLTHQEFANKIKEAIPQEERLKEVFVDSASPELIHVLASIGVNAHKAKKDVVAGINACKQHLQGVTAESVNLIKELNTYKWKQNKDGEVVDEPLKFMDHALDAGRYGTYSKIDNYGTGKVLNIRFR